MFGEYWCKMKRLGVCFWEMWKMIFLVLLMRMLDINWKYLLWEIVIGFVFLIFVNFKLFRFSMLVLEDIFKMKFVN